MPRKTADIKHVRMIKNNIITFAACIGFAAAALLAGVNFFTEREQIFNQARTKIHTMADLYADLVAQDLKLSQTDRLKQISNSFARQQSLDLVHIYDSDSQVLVRSGDSSDHDTRLRMMASESIDMRTPMLTEYKKRFVISLPVSYGEDILGAVLIQMDARPQFQVFIIRNVFNISLCLLAALLSIRFALILIQPISEPIRQMTEFFHRTNPKRLTDRIHIESGNELDSLAMAINSMLERVDASMNYVQHLAFVDPVTKLPNRERFMREVASIFSKKSPECMCAIIILDVDRFHWVNEILGPQKGDEALAQIGQRIASSVKIADKTIRMNIEDTPPAFVARVAADEFGLLIPGVENKAQLARILQMIIAAMRQPLLLGKHRLTLGVSAGIAVAPDDADLSEDLIKHAELALKQAKSEGAGKARFFTQKLNRIAVDRLNLETEIRAGIENNEFTAVYQPKIDFASGNIIGAEALARWQRQNGELVSPGVFIPIAEEVGFISDIGEAILNDACHTAVQWMEAGHDCKIAVNVSPRQFDDPVFPDKVLTALRNAGLPPARLELEITETMAVDDPEHVSEIMRPLRTMGVCLAIDDFGAGHSNLVTLTRLPFDVFKIDQQFVRALHSDKQAPAIIEMILAMAKTMGLETVAEGVETTAQSDFLRHRGCTIGQGYLFSPPVPRDGFADILDNWQPFGEKTSKSKQA